MWCKTKEEKAATIVWVNMDNDTCYMYGQSMLFQTVLETDQIWQKGCCWAVVVVLLVSLQHLPNQCWILSIPVAIDGGIVVQFGTRPRRRRQQQSFGSIQVTRLYGHYVMILVMCMVKACFSLFPHSILIHLGEKYITTTQ